MRSHRRVALKLLGLLAWSMSALTLTPLAAEAQQQQRDPQVRVEMSADRTELGVRDNVTLRIYVQTQGSGQPDIEVPEFEGFQVVQRAVQRPMQFSFGFGNNQPVVTSTTQYTFVLVPTGPGTFKIPPVKVSFGQRVFQSKALALTVTGGDAAQPAAQPAQQGQQAQQAQQAQPAQPANAAPAAQAAGDAAIFDNEAFLRTVVDKLEPYEGEQVTATIYLYARHNLQQAPAVQTEAGTDGFWVQDLLSATRSLEPTRQVLNGRGFWVYTLRRFAAFPLRSGEMTIGSMALTISRESVFDLFDPGRAGPSELQRRSVPVLLHVKSLPEENKPAGQIAVGKFEIKSAVDRSQVATGDAVTWTATLRGQGNLRAVKLAEQSVKGLQILQPEVRDLTEAPGDLVQSTRSFGWLVVPQAPGSYELPVLALNTFDPTTGSYKRVSSEPVTLTAAGSAVAGSAPASGTKAGDGKPGDGDSNQGKEPDEQEVEPWPPLHTNSALQRPTTAIASRPFYPALALLWPLLWLGVNFGPGLVARARMRAGGAGSAEQTALRRGRKRLNDARRALGAHDARTFHSDVAAALTTALEARLGESIGGMTQTALRQRLAQHGMPDTLSSDVCELLARCDFARFSSASVSDTEMQQLLTRAEALWTNVENFSVRQAVA